MKKSFEKFAGALYQMPERRMAFAAMIGYLALHLAQPVPLCADELFTEQNKFCAFGIGKDQKIGRIDQFVVKPEGGDFISAADQQMDVGKRMNQVCAETVEPSAPADIAADQPVEKCDDCKQSDVVGKPCEQRFRELDKSIHDTFLLSVMLIFIMRLFSSVNYHKN